MEENFSVEWNMEWKIFSMEWKKISRMEYGKIVSIPFHVLPVVLAVLTKSKRRMSIPKQNV